MTEANMYHCAVCGNSYETIEERAACESKCLVERKKAEELRRKNEFESNRKASVKAIEDALNNVNEMVSKHLKEYETFTINKHYPYLKYIFSNSHWWF